MTDSSSQQDTDDSFLSRLSRTRVIKTLAIYISVGWVLTEIATGATETFNLPDWVAGGALALLISGIPVVVFLAWTFQITREGITVQVTSWKGGLAIAVALMLLLGISTWLIGNLETNPRLTSSLPKTVSTESVDVVETDRSPDKSIAVLPFADLSPGDNDGYLSTGIAEEIRHALTNLNGLKVAAGTSSGMFNGTTEDIQTIGEKLNVQAVLVGSVLHSDNLIRVTVQLINIADGYQLWSERYEREMTTIFEIQDSIAQNIVKKLEVKGQVDPDLLVSGRHPDNVDAYRLYLRGKYYAANYDEPDLRTAIGYFREALAARPDYAKAYAGLADAYGSLDYFGHVRPLDIDAQHRSAVNRALELDPYLAEAHFSLARLLFNRQWDKDAAEVEFLRALQLDPSDPWKHGLYAIFLSTQGRHEEALNHAVTGRDLDPLSLSAVLTPGWIHFFNREYDLALAAGRQAMASDPAFVNAIELVAYSRFRKGERDAAISMMEKATSMADFPIVLGNLGRMYGLAGRNEDASNVLNTLLDMAQNEYIPASTIANVYIGLGDYESANKWMNEAIANRESSLSILNVVSDDKTRANPYFNEWLQAIGLPKL